MQIIYIDCISQFHPTIIRLDTSTPCERLFSEAGAIADRKRASLSPEHVEMLTCLHHNLSTFGLNTAEGMDLDADHVDDP